MDFSFAKNDFWCAFTIDTKNTENKHYVHMFEKCLNRQEWRWRSMKTLFGTILFRRIRDYQGAHQFRPNLFHQLKINFTFFSLALNETFCVNCYIILFLQLFLFDPLYFPHYLQRACQKKKRVESKLILFLWIYEDFSCLYFVSIQRRWKAW